VTLVRGFGIFVCCLRLKRITSNNSMLIFREMGLILMNEIVWIAWETRSNNLEVGSHLSISLKAEGN
jgi:hypothetical protein